MFGSSMVVLDSKRIISWKQRAKENNKAENKKQMIDTGTCRRSKGVTTPLPSSIKGTENRDKKWFVVRSFLLSWHARVYCYFGHISVKCQTRSNEYSFRWILPHCPRCEAFLRTASARLTSLFSLNRNIPSYATPNLSIPYGLALTALVS